MICVNFEPVWVWQRLATISGDPLMKARAERPPWVTVTTLILCRAEEKGNLCTIAIASSVDWEKNERINEDFRQVLDLSKWQTKQTKKKKLRCLSLRVFIYPPALATSAYQLSCIRKEAQTKYIFHYQQPKHRSNYLKNNRCPYNNFTVSKHSL